MQPGILAQHDHEYIGALRAFYEARSSVVDSAAHAAIQTA